MFAFFLVCIPVMVIIKVSLSPDRFSFSCFAALESDSFFCPEPAEELFLGTMFVCFFLALAIIGLLVDCFSIAHIPVNIVAN